MSDERTVVSISLDDDLLAWVDSESDNRSAFIQNLIKEARDGRTEIDEALTEAEIRRVETRIDAVESELDAERAYLQELREKRAEHVATAEEYEQRLGSVLDDLEATDGHVWPSSQPVLDIGDEFDTSAREVIADLKSQAAAEDRDLTTYNFMRADEARMTQTQPRPISEVVTDGDD